MTGGDSDFVAKSLLNPGTPDSSDTDTPDWSLTEAFWSRAGQAYWAAPLIRDILPGPKLLMGAVMMGLALGQVRLALLTSFNSEAARKVTLSAQATKASFAPFPSPSPSPSTTPEGFHPGAVCDKTGQGPIVGRLFHLTGENYDLCEAEFNQLLPEAEKASYEKLAPPRVDCRAEIAEATRREVKETRKQLAEAVGKGKKCAFYVAKKREGWRKLLLAKAKRDRRQARQ